MDIDILKREIVSVETSIASANQKTTEIDKDIRRVNAEIQQIEEILKLKKQKEEQLKAIEDRQKNQIQRLEELKKKLDSFRSYPIAKE